MRLYSRIREFVEYRKDSRKYDDGIHPRADRVHVPLQVLRDIAAYAPAKVKE